MVCPNCGSKEFIVKESPIKLYLLCICKLCGKKLYVI